MIPSCLATGRRSGVMIINAAPPSRNIPMIRRITLHAKRNSHLFVVRLNIADATTLGRLIQVI